MSDWIKSPFRNCNCGHRLSFVEWPPSAYKSTTLISVYTYVAPTEFTLGAYVHIRNMDTSIRSFWLNCGVIYPTTTFVYWSKYKVLRLAASLKNNQCNKSAVWHWLSHVGVLFFPHFSFIPVRRSQTNVKIPAHTNKAHAIRVKIDAQVHEPIRIHDSMWIKLETGSPTLCFVVAALSFVPFILDKNLTKMSVHTFVFGDACVYASFLVFPCACICISVRMRKE